MDTCTFEEVRKVVMLERSAKASVWLVDVRGEKFCLKEVAKEGLSQSEAENLLNEKKALLALNHDQVIKLHRTFQDPSNIYFLLQLARGAPLNHVVKHSRMLGQALTQSIIKQTAEVLGHLHSRGFVYRDLKLSNVFLSATAQVMLIDLGLCTEIGTGR
jgi:serine/threonine protein kinase